MSELLEIIISAVDQATDVFQGIGDTVSSSADEIQSQFEQATSEVERLEEELAAIYMGDIEGDAEAVETALSEAQDEAERLAQAIDDIEKESDETKESIDGIADLMAFQQVSEWVGQLADKMWELADKAGTVQDSWTRMGLAAEGANIPVDQMKDSVSALSSETGRAGGSIRESFIAMSSAGVTELSAMESAFKGASAQSFILGTDVDSLVNKFSGMAMKSSIAERSLKGTGITVEELGDVLGIQGATIDDVNAKWETMDTNARMAALGQASAMNEGKDANDAYKNSWEGLQAQIDIAKGKLEVLAGKVFLPVLIPVMQAAAKVLDWLGTTISSVMDGPLGGFISILGSAAGGLLLVVGAVAAVSAGMGFFTASLWPAITASWALIAPWLPFIAIGAAIIAIVYEVGKAFHWWNDASSMIDAVGAGLQRLWSAFINHPDVQAIISTITSAWNTFTSAVGWAWNELLKFFGVATGGEFDIVRAIIDGLGVAWEAVTLPMRTVFGLFELLYPYLMEFYESCLVPLGEFLGGVFAEAWTLVGELINFITPYVTALTDAFTQFMNGQISLPDLILSVLTTLWNLYSTITTQIITLVWNWGSQLLTNALQAGSNFVSGVISFIQTLPARVLVFLVRTATYITNLARRWVEIARQKASQLVTGVISFITQLPGKVYSGLISVVDRISSAIQSWINTASQKVSQLIKDITSPFSGVVDSISSALSGVKDAIVAPFQWAWDKLEPIVSKIQDAMSIIGGSGGDAAGGLAAGGFDEFITQDNIVSVESDETVLVEFKDDLDLNINIDGLPDGVSTDDVLALFREFFNDPNFKDDFIRYIVGSSLFQKLDNKAKTRLLNKGNRARGV